MEINLKNKEKFFAQYYGQTIQIDSDLEGNKYPLTISNIAFEPEKCHLILKPLSSISKEDMKYIMDDDVMNPDIDCTYTNEIGDLKLSQLVTSDYLRSKGYALPWMGFSVENQIKYGWIKLV